MSVNEIKLIILFVDQQNLVHIKLILSECFYSMDINCGQEEISALLSAEFMTLCTATTDGIARFIPLLSAERN